MRAVDVPQRVGNGIEVTERYLADADIETKPVTRGRLVPIVKVIGTATFAPTHVAAVGTRGPGVVKDVKHVEGDFVPKGELLAEVESPSLSNAQADLAVANAKREAAALNRDRERSLLERGLTTAREAEQAEAALKEERALASAAIERVHALGGGNREGLSQLRAPLAGVVAERNVSAGQSVGPGFVAFRVGDLDELWVVLTVFERHLTVLHAGDPVEIRPVNDEQRVIHGKIAHVGSVLDPGARTADVRVVVDNDGLLLRPGQAVNAVIHAGGTDRVALSVPESALTYVDGKPTVFVAETKTRFVPREVELGVDGGDQVEITKGVTEGTRVVSKSVLALKSELFR
jgi:cobalt-zinc-cadmium efflux system membrane fusion protein